MISYTSTPLRFRVNCVHFNSILLPAEYQTGGIFIYMKNMSVRKLNIMSKKNLILCDMVESF